MKEMIIIGRNESRTLHICPCFKMIPITEAVEAIDESITTYYSNKHAYDEGWRLTSDIKYCEPGMVSVWVCPDCSRKEGWF